MITRRPAGERGRTRTDWLDSYHTFSFNRYYDPRHVGFRGLRVINEDFVAPAAGFPPHSHRDMEIITYVTRGALEHRDSMGNQSVIRPGEVQRMSAGTGVTHSEYNPSPDAPVHLLQIWIEPERAGLPPSYEQKEVSAEGAGGRLRLIASRGGRGDSVNVHQDVEVYSAVLDEGDEAAYELKAGRHAWVQLVRGSLSLNGEALGPGDGAAVSEESGLVFKALEPSELILFDLA
jgi:quercetin 2,3-dioxygenase